MVRKAIVILHRALGCLMVLTVMHGIAAADTAPPLTAHHDLSISLMPEKSALAGWDQIRIERSQSLPIELILSPRARIRELRVNGRTRSYTFDQGRLTLSPQPGDPVMTAILSVAWLCRFDDPVPEAPVNTDNPGFGVTGTISAKGTFILSGAGWYPQVSDARESFDLRVDGPRDTVAVTTGRLQEITHKAQSTLSHWRIARAPEGLSLSAGPYAVDRQTQNGVSVATYFLASSRPLAPTYLEASLHYLKRYSDLLGDYAFDGFAVVENFFPTGYGFAGYTLMGSTVLRLPFIPQTSLPHEIAHNWWGNGVLVDYSYGNWCEGLTSYTADYLNQELTSSAAARNYRRQALRNYASLVSEATDLPLSRFHSRTDPATKAVGYDKSLMVFHMLRQELGDPAFWAALRDLYREFLFKRAAWQDLQLIFERHAGRSLAFFFRQWIERTGAPQPRLENVRRVAEHPGYRTTGRLVQNRPYYDLSLQLVVETAGGPIRKMVHLTGRQTEFDIPSPQLPLALAADPDVDFFRRLTPQEIPPTVNTIRGSTSVVLVMANRLGGAGPSMARHFARAMGITPARTLREADFSASDAAESDLLFIGLPQNAQQIALLPRELDLDANRFRLADRRFDAKADVLFMVARHPGPSKTVVALLHPLASDAADQVIGKIPHYGRYSYLAFRNGHNRVKGTWESQASSMTVRWGPANATNQGATP